MIKLIESLKEGKHYSENLTFLNMKKYSIYKIRPYMSSGLEVFEIEKELSLEDKIKIIDIFDNNTATYMLDIIIKWDNEKDSLPKDRWDNPKTVSVKAWIKRNDPLNKIDIEFKIGRYYLFKRRFESLSIKCPSTEYEYSMEYTGEHVVNQWFHELCVMLYKVESMKIKNILANYDLFQYDNRIKPDYCNVTTIDMWDEVSDGEGNPGWCNWTDEEDYEIDCYELVDGKAVLEECYR